MRLNPKLLPLLRRLWINIPSRRRAQCGLLLLLTMVASLVEVVSIGAVLPFLGVLTDPDRVFAHPAVQPMIALLDVAHPEQLLLPLTVFFSAAALFSGAVRLMLLWAQTRLGHAIGADLSIEVYRRTLHQPYVTHLARNSSELIAGITVKTSALVNNTVLPTLTIVSSTVMLVAILSLLILIDPITAIGAFSGFAAIYLLVIVVTKRGLARNSQRISRESGQVIKALQEGLGGIRDVLLDGTQKLYCQIYLKSDLPLRRAQANIQIRSGSPRFVIEALAIALIAWLAFSMARDEYGISSAIPVLGALAIGAQRLLPVLQHIYISIAAMRGGQSSLCDALDLLEQTLPTYAEEGPFAPMAFEKLISLRGLDYRYKADAPKVLQGIDLDIRKGSRIGFIGKTGGGKSTLLDVVMGLLEPEKGQLRVDGVLITGVNRRGWQTHICHVPQTIFLADASIAENIAFGVPVEEIDYDRVRQVAHSAEVGKTIEAMPESYQTMIGEGGLRLSGGQRQRIGIARALYKNADVIVLDEATSALDNDTERLVMNAIAKLGCEYTVLMVAHRLSTLADCERIVELKQGRIHRIGSYSEITGV